MELATDQGETEEGRGGNGREAEAPAEVVHGEEPQRFHDGREEVLRSLVATPQPGPLLVGPFFFLFLRATTCFWLQGRVQDRKGGRWPVPTPSELWGEESFHGQVAPPHPPDVQAVPLQLTSDDPPGQLPEPAVFEIGFSLVRFLFMDCLDCWQVPRIRRCHLHDK
jgi:hypothetical protein